MNNLIKTLAVVATCALLATSAFAQSAASLVVPIENEPAPRLFVEPPLPGPLASGVAFIPYRVENLRIMPVAVRPRATSLRGSDISHHRRRPSLAVGGLRPEQHHNPG